MNALDSSEEGRMGGVPQLALLSTIATDRRVGLVSVSRLGVSLEAPDLPSEGEDVIFQADSIQLFGRIAWSCDGQCGITFAAPLTANMVESLRSEAMSAEPF